MTAVSLPPRFDPGPIDARWQRAWRESGVFRAPDAPTGPAFTIVLPPPNVTGILTIGHMLGGTVQDVLVRWHRMRGEPTLWLPGIDHAGLSTQVEVGRRLAKQGIRIETLSREEVIRRVEEWRHEYESRIQAQTDAAGFSQDRSRYRYTMDPGFVRATRRAFVRLYHEGLIYRGERIVNWDPKLRTALSDLEVVRREEPAELLYVRYPWADGAEGGIVVATVRPETIFGDVAVAVHPDDPRHAAAVGRSVRVPLTDRVVPVISDDLVDPTFGNGALKVTPGHDLLDFQIGRRHAELAKAPSVIDPTGHLASEWVPPPFRGMDRMKGRAETTAALRAGGFLDRVEPYVHSVGHSQRSDAVVEPLLSTQWFVRMTALAGPAVEAVRSGAVKLHPERWELTYYRWMESIEDWCISRQVSWGHPIPVLYCEQCHTEIVEEDTPERCPKCDSARLAPDPDVLDTWCSSWLWPFASLGWPESTPDLAAYFPTSVLVTGRDIMFFWVARMLMASYHFTGQRPFSDVYFTGMLRDEQGRRMSKHLGNSPDPLAVIGQWGADPMRFGLLFPNPADQDASFKEASLEGARNFLTKMWNLVRLLASHLPEGTEPPTHAPSLGPDARLEDRWILSRWSRTSSELDRALAGFDFTQAASILREFLWHDVADRYVELAKDALAGRSGESDARRSRGVLLFVLERSLRQLHPMVPHVTEELWHALPHSGELLATAPWPRPEEAPTDAGAEVAMGSVLELVRMVRSLRADANLPPSEQPEAWVRPASAELGELFARESDAIRRLARLGTLHALAPEAPAPAETNTAIGEIGAAFLGRPATAEGTDSEALVRERDKIGEILRKTEGRLADAGFRSRAPAEVVREAEEKTVELRERIRKIDEHLGASPPPVGAAG